MREISSCCRKDGFVAAAASNADRAARGGFFCFLAACWLSPLFSRMENVAKISTYVVVEERTYSMRGCVYGNSPLLT